MASSSGGFTGGVSDTAGPIPAAHDTGTATGSSVAAGRKAERRAAVVAGRWGGVAELSADLVPALRLTALLVLAGIPAGLLWWLLAPREDYRVLGDGAVEALGDTSSELFAADDVVFVLILGGLGLLAGIGAWFLRRRRGVTMLAALAVGTGLAGVLAWQLGELLGPGPTAEDLSDVGATVTTRLELASMPALAVAPFLAVLVYVVATLLAAGEDLGRTPDGRPGPAVPGRRSRRPAPALQTDPGERRFSA
jgi:LPXTG-motif cell wall-anchored protein